MEIAPQERNSVASEYRTVDLDFTIRQAEIDYFKLDPAIVSAEQFNVQEHLINLQPTEYLNLDSHFPQLDHTVKETVVLNIPVGCGKTTLCYDLVRKYHDEGYYVIVCSPFQKLVEKDYAALREHFSETQIYNYKQLDFDRSTLNFDEIIALEARVHVMTINCLLQNPGDEHYDQAFYKSRFLYNLRKKIEDREKKVVFFFDEIHESISNFENEFIPYLFKWRYLTHKCYVSSATFTPASIPVIRFISFLTEAAINIYTTPRTIRGDETTRARLHLHISDDPFTKGNLSPLNPIISLIDSYLEAGSKINILSGFKAIVKALTDNRADSQLIQKIRSLNPNICTGDTDNEFNPDRHNIGTNFKTGVNITVNNGVLIILLPTVNQDSSIKHYGIFTDGIPSIIQSVARLREGGNIHIFMLTPEKTLDFENIGEHLPEELIPSDSIVEYHSVNHSYETLKEKYDRKVGYLRKDIDFMNEMVEGFDELKYHYPTFQDFLIQRSQTLSVKKYIWMGKSLSPYVLWAAVNNQFCNAVLTSIHYRTKNVRQINLNAENEFEELLALLSEEEKQILKSKSLSDGLSLIPRYIGTSIVVNTDMDGRVQRQAFNNKFNYNGRDYTVDRLKNHSSIKPILVKILVFIKSEESINLSKEFYIRTCIANSQQYQGNDLPELISLYQSFKIIKDQFISFIQNKAEMGRNEQIIHKDYYLQLPQSFIENTIQLVQRLKQKDKVFQSSIFSFFQNHTSTLTMDDIDGTKKKITLEFEKLFSSIDRSCQGARRTLNGQKNAYYALEARLEISEELSWINFLGR